MYAGPEFCEPDTRTGHRDPSEETKGTAADREPDADQVLQGEPGVAVHTRRPSDEAVRKRLGALLSLGG